MNEPMRLTSVSNPRVKAVVRLRDRTGAGGRRKTGRFIAEGRREVTRAAEAGLTLRAVYGCAELLGEPTRSFTARWSAPARAGFEVVEVSEPVLRKMAYLREPEGVLAVVDQPDWTLESLPAVTDQTLLLVAVGTEKPGNLGAMVRTAAAAGCSAVIAAGQAVDPFHPNAIRNSTGAVFAVPTVEATEADALSWLTDQGVRIFAATPRGAVPHTRATYLGPTAIVIGPEDRGLSDAWLTAADTTDGARVVIPMPGQAVDSLNASAAAAVLLFEALRQR